MVTRRQCLLGAAGCLLLAVSAALLFGPGRATDSLAGCSAVLLAGGVL